MREVSPQAAEPNLMGILRQRINNTVNTGAEVGVRRYLEPAVGIALLYPAA